MAYTQPRWYQREGKILEALEDTEEDGRLLSFEELVKASGLDPLTAQLGLQALLDGSYVRGVDVSDHDKFDYLDIRLLPAGRERLGEWPNQPAGSSTTRSGQKRGRATRVNVFLSWSGQASHQLALTLREWLPSILPQVHGWVSSEDIPKGRRWGRELDEQLQDTVFCIVCIVPGNLSEPWINFEAGAIAREIDQAHVIPFLLGLGTEALDRSPLGMFQATLFEKQDVMRLLTTINDALDSQTASEDLAKLYEERWPALKKEIERIDLDYEDNDDEYDDDDDGTYVLEEGAEKVLGVVADANSSVTSTAIARQLNEPPTRIQYWLDGLVRRGLVHDHLSMSRPVKYSLTASGRAYLVENDLI